MNVDQRMQELRNELGKFAQSVGFGYQVRPPDELLRKISLVLGTGELLFLDWTTEPTPSAFGQSLGHTHYLVAITTEIAVSANARGVNVRGDLTEESWSEHVVAAPMRVLDRISVDANQTQPVSWSLHFAHGMDLQIPLRLGRKDKPAPPDRLDAADRLLGRTLFQ